MTTPLTVSAERTTRRAALARRVRWLVAATISYNVMEAVVAISAGTVANSAALLGFGLDSVIEVSSAAAVAWQFAAADPERREKTALRIIAISFFALAGYVTIDAVATLSGGSQAEHSTVGLVLAAVSLAVMPALSLTQRRVGRELGSRSAVADSRQTLLCTYLSAVLLVGLALNSLLGWSWADPMAALVIAAVAVKEGRNAWRGDMCCAAEFPAQDRSGGPGCVHDHCDADQAHERSDDVPAVGTELVDQHSPGQRAGHEHAAVCRQDAAEVRVGLERRDEPVQAEGDDPRADPHQAAVFPHTLPDQPGAADLRDRGHHEQQDRFRHRHAR
jgi:Co/Zn/Cd efflux system component